MTATPFKTETIVEAEGWAALDVAALSETCFAAVEKRIPGVGSPVCILFTDDAAMTALNETWRGKKQPTNVLSFPAGEALRPEEAWLGDIALAFETCRREAEEKGVTLHDHAAHLIIHGLLHLIGYDHEEEGEAAAMERVETELLEGMGIENPYADALETSE